MALCGRKLYFGMGLRVVPVWRCCLLLAVILAVTTGAGQQAFAQGETAPSQDETPKVVPADPPAFEGSMTIERMDEIVKRLDEKVRSPRQGVWQFAVEKQTVLIVTDEKNDRMRIMVAIRPAADVPADLMLRMMQANFDTALDSRYAVAREILWATFIHPLRALHDRQFVTAIGQTVNLSVTFGTTYSSGLLSFRDGDSRGIIQRQLIDGLLKKGLPI